MNSPEWSLDRIKVVNNVPYQLVWTVFVVPATKLVQVHHWNVQVLILVHSGLFRTLTAILGEKSILGQYQLIFCVHNGLPPFCLNFSNLPLKSQSLFQPHAGNYWSHFHISFSPRAGNFTPENIQPSLLMSFLAFSAHQAQSCNFDLALCFFCQNGSCNL